MKLNGSEDYLNLKKDFKKQIYRILLLIRQRGKGQRIIENDFNLSSVD